MNRISTYIAQEEYIDDPQKMHKRIAAQLEQQGSIWNYQIDDLNVLFSLLEEELLDIQFANQEKPIKEWFETVMFPSSLLSFEIDSCYKNNNQQGNQQEYNYLNFVISISEFQPKEEISLTTTMIDNYFSKLYKNYISKINNDHTIVIQVDYNNEITAYLDYLQDGNCVVNEVHGEDHYGDCFDYIVDQPENIESSYETISYLKTVLFP